MADDVDVDPLTIVELAIHHAPSTRENRNDIVYNALDDSKYSGIT